MAIFDSKNFNGNVFKQYVDRVPNLNRNELIKSRAVKKRQDIAQSMSDQVGGNFVTIPLRGIISGTAPQNYDGSTNITATGTKTFSHSRIVVGRAQAWTERDFSYDITGGEDSLANVAAQISEYWEEVDQATIIKILAGIFSMKDAEGLKFVREHTYDVTGMTNSEGVLGLMDGTTLNTAMQRACGDNKGAFSLAIMHSAVATGLENIKLLAYMKYTDKDGIERELAIGTLNGRAVLVDDTMPAVETVTTPEALGAYTITISTAGTAGDTITVDGQTYTLGSVTSTANKTLNAGDATTEAQALKTVLTAQYDGRFAVSVSAGVVTLKQIFGGEGALPVVSVTGTLKATAAQTVAGVAKVSQVRYTTYVLGDGAIEYTDCGAKVPYEMDRNPSANGGEDTLYGRQRKCFAPYGINFTKAHMASLSPTDEDLENGENWELVNSNEAEGKQYIARKAIPIARILSLA